MDLEALTDLRTAWCLYVAVTLRIAEHLAAGEMAIASLAAAARCDARVLQLMLRHLVTKGFFAEAEPGRFALNEPARQLMSPAARLGMDLEGFGGRMAYAWGSLLSFVRTGAPAYHEIFGMPFWEDLDAHPEVAASFDSLIGPGGHGAFSPDFELAGGWENVRHIVDVGGGTGAMLAAVLRARPGLRGTLLDLPRTVERSREIFRDAGVADRVTLAGQSFFDPLPAGADLYLLRGVVNNWPDAQAGLLLRRCAEAARPNARVVVLKSVGPDDSRPALTIDVLLTGGQHRTVAEFRTLAAQAGLSIVRAGQQPAYFVVECRPD